MGEELLEAQAVEEPLAGDEPLAAARALPERPDGGQLEAWRGEVRTAAIAAAGGLVAGAATVAAVRAVRGGSSQSTRAGVLRRNRGGRPLNAVASRSFLVDVHVLGR